LGGHWSSSTCAVSSSAAFSSCLRSIGYIFIINGGKYTDQHHHVVLYHRDAACRPLMQLLLEKAAQVLDHATTLWSLSFTTGYYGLINFLATILTSFLQV
jgi:hypothetical protein